MISKWTRYADPQPMRVLVQILTKTRGFFGEIHRRGQHRRFSAEFSLFGDRPALDTVKDALTKPYCGGRSVKNCDRLRTGRVETHGMLTVCRSRF